MQQTLRLILSQKISICFDTNVNTFTKFHKQQIHLSFPKMWINMTYIYNNSSSPVEWSNVHPNSLPFLDVKSNTFKVDSIVLTLTLLRYQSHSWTHSKSCFNKFAHMPFGVVCHFPFPQSTTLVTMVNSLMVNAQFQDHSTTSNWQWIHQWV